MNPIDTAVRDYHLLEPGEMVVAAVSGGADSVVLLHWLAFRSPCRVVAAHLNHGLRGAESDRDEAFVRTLCESWGIPCFVRRADVAAEVKAQGKTLEEMGRECRYRFFEEVRREQGAQKIATAHTLSDNAETLLLRLARGTGLYGLCGIPIRRGGIVRPLLLCTRLEIEDYCREYGLSYVTDSTNLEDIYARNHIRLETIPSLKKLNPELERGMGHTIEILREEQEYLEGAAREAYAACRVPEGLSCRELSRLHTALQRRVIGLALEGWGLPKSFREIEALAGMAREGRGKLTIAQNTVLTVHRGILQPARPEIPYFQVEVPLSKPFTVANARYQADLMERNCEIDFQKVYKKLLYLCLDYDKIKDTLIIRQRLPGDSISLVNRGGRKTLKKLFIEEKLAAWEKAEQLVLADSGGVAGIFGFGPDERCRVDAGTRRVLCLRRLDVPAPADSEA